MSTSHCRQGATLVGWRVLILVINIACPFFLIQHDDLDSHCFKPSVKHKLESDIIQCVKFMEDGQPNK
jgi:hypothetical protein